MPASYTNTLRYWFDVEALMYPELPKPGSRRHYTLRYQDQLPWQNDLAETDWENQKYFAYFGLVQKAVLDPELFELFRTTPEEEDLSGARSRKIFKQGKTFLLAIEVSGDGIPSLSTLQLAAYAITFAERKNDKQINSQILLQAVKDKISNLRSDAEQGRVDASWFEQVTEFLIDELDWKPRELMAREQLCVHRVPLKNRSGKPFKPAPDLPPINSFYIDDLERIRHRSEHGSDVPQVKAYLESALAIDKRVDVTELDTINQILQPRHQPQGRWPSKFPLFLMQQVAVNKAMEALRGGGVFSVNGPPGTGKTTLLMDVIAARIVERAQLLASFERPQDAFTETPSRIAYPPNQQGEIISGPCYFLDERLLDFGIVVASSNNKAVENITQDLPNLTKVFPQPLLLDGVPFSYFAQTAEAILNQKDEDGAKAGPVLDPEEAVADVDSEQDNEPIQCWGLVSVALGKQKNRKKVAAHLGRFSEVGLQAQLNALDAQQFGWGCAKKRLADALAEVDDIQREINEFDRTLPLLEIVQTVLNKAMHDVTLIDEQHAASLDQLRVVADAAVSNDADTANNLAERSQYSRDWPWWRVLLAKWFHPEDYARMFQQRQELEGEFSTLRLARKDLKKRREELNGIEKALAGQLRTLRAAVIAGEKELERVRKKLNELSESLGTAAFVPEVFLALPTQDQQKALIRSNAKLQEARASVFVAAMALHMAFMKHAGKGFETNFRLALAMLEDQAFLQPYLSDMALHLWSTLFLAVPVVSSTFASVSRCFRYLSEGQIGLLLIDEAGQSVPSHALGAIWRSKRALIVGDPLQVEPVITMDNKLDVEILRYHGAPEEHLLTRYSAQHLADRRNLFGAYVEQYDGSSLWVGSPLRVHRRCVDPMFSIANKIAYNEKMVFGPQPEEEVAATRTRPLLGNSRWIDVKGEDFDDHYSPTEGQAVLDLIVDYQRQNLSTAGDGLPELYIISPFKSVATAMTELLSEHASMWASDVAEKSINEWLRSHVGTVHTFQGKESEMVIFVLGGKTAGARSWAASRPNIINVAVTRAKRRLYVIGNFGSWMSTPFGAVLYDGINMSGENLSLRVSKIRKT